MRKRIYEIIEIANENDKVSKAYDFFMIIAIVVSIVPLCTHESNLIYQWIDKFTVAIFIVDYALRLFTADYKMEKGLESFVLYPFTFMALVDLVSILPSLSLLGKGFKLLKLARLIRTLRVFRVFKTFRYSKSINMIIEVFKKQKNSLIVVCAFAITYVLVSALVVFNIEPETFNSFFDALYWATISLTTVGYGDIYAVSKLGKVITMISSVLGIAIVALPAGIITAGYMTELEEQNNTVDKD